MLSKQARSAHWKRWYSKHRVERNENRKKHRATHEKEFFLQRRIWGLNRRHKGQTVAALREITDLWDKQNGICVLTGRALTYKNAQLDHIIPVARGGLGTADNLRWVHKDVNRIKCDRTDAEFDSVCVDRAKMLGMSF